MLESVISQNCDLSAAEVTRLLAYSPEQVAVDPVFLEAVNALDVAYLEETLQDARAAIQSSIEPIASAIQKEYALSHNPMSADTLGNWLLGFVENPSQLHMFINLHNHLPNKMLRDYLPNLLGMFNSLNGSGEEWRRAMATLSIVILAKEN